MEFRNQKPFTISPLACLAVIGASIALATFGYYQFRANQEKTVQAREASKMIQDAMTAQKDYWKQIDKAFAPTR